MRTAQSGRGIRRIRWFAVFGILAALLLGACGHEAADSTDGRESATPTASITPPAGVTLTKAGSSLEFGETATVAQSANQKKAAIIQVSVRSISRGTIADLRGYDIDATAAASTPYYAHVRVKNLGPGDLGGTGIPLWGNGSDDTLIGASGFTSSFARCPSGPLPRSFGAGATETTCLVFLAPRGVTLTGASFRPATSAKAVEWSGTITTPASRKSGKKAPS